MASFFAVVVVKWSFGGLGSNWMNPALAGRVFVFFSWTNQMSRWSFPLEKGHRFFTRLFVKGNLDAFSTASVDSVSAATPLGVLKTTLSSGDNIFRGPMELLMGQGNPISYSDLFWGLVPGCIGEISAFLLLAGALYLFLRKIITWPVPLAYLCSFSILIWIWGGRPYGQGFFTGDVLFHLLSGGLILGVFFMATDMATTPMTLTGQIIFGIGCGFMTFLIRVYGSFPEGVSLAIIFMNIFVPLIDKLIKPKRFGLILKQPESGV